MKNLLFTFLIILTFSTAFAQENEEPETFFTISEDSAYVIMPFNISFVPGMSIGDKVSNGKKIKNIAALNILIGKADKLAGIDIAGLMSHYREESYGAMMSGIMNSCSSNFNGAQWAGVINLSGGDFQGAQIAGIVNIVDNNVSGCQWAGIANVNGGNSEGVQFAGIANVTDGTVEGAQWAGIANVTEGNSEGVRWAGIANINNGSFNGAQWAGIANICGSDVEGASFAGISNISDDLTGIAMAGIANIADKLDGVQMAGVVNIANNVSSGAQIGVVNLSAVNKGLPIGLVSYVKQQGLHCDVWADDSKFVHIGLRSGNESFYNLLYLALGKGDSTYLASGYALGAHTNFNKEFFFEAGLDAKFIHALDNDFFDDDFKMIAKLNLHFGYDLGLISVYAGPSISIYLAESDNGNDLVPWTISETTFSNDLFDHGTLKTWIGLSAGIRL